MNRWIILLEGELGAKWEQDGWACPVFCPECGGCQHKDGPPIGEPCPGLGVRNPDGSGCPATPAPPLREAWKIEDRDKAFSEWYRRQDFSTASEYHIANVSWHCGVQAALAQPAEAVIRFVSVPDNLGGGIEARIDALGGDAYCGHGTTRQEALRVLADVMDTLEGKPAQPAGEPLREAVGKFLKGWYASGLTPDNPVGHLVNGLHAAFVGCKSNDWVAVSERLPEKEGDYLVWTKESVSAKTSQYYCGEWGLNATITHWMPLPPAPEEKK